MIPIIIPDDDYIIPFLNLDYSAMAVSQGEG